MKSNIVYLLFPLLLCCTNEYDDKKEVAKINKIMIGENQYGDRLKIEYGGGFGYFSTNYNNNTSIYYGYLKEIDKKIVFIPQKECTISEVRKTNKDSLSNKLYINSFLNEYLPVELTVEESIQNISSSIRTSVDLKKYSPLFVKTKVVYKDNIISDSVFIDPRISSLQIDTDKYYDSVVIIKDKTNIELKFFKKDKLVLSSSWYDSNR